MNNYFEMFSHEFIEYVDPWKVLSDKLKKMNRDFDDKMLIQKQERQENKKWKIFKWLRTSK